MGFYSHAQRKAAWHHGRDALHGPASFGCFGSFACVVHVSLLVHLWGVLFACSRGSLATLSGCWSSGIPRSSHSARSLPSQGSQMAKKEKQKGHEDSHDSVCFYWRSHVLQFLINCFQSLEQDFVRECCLRRAPERIPSSIPRGMPQVACHSFLSFRTH